MAESVNTGGLKKFVYDGKMGNSEKYIKETLKNDLMEDYFKIWMKIKQIYGLEI